MTPSWFPSLELFQGVLLFLFPFSVSVLNKFASFNLFYWVIKIPAAIFIRQHPGKNMVATPYKLKDTETIKS